MWISRDKTEEGLINLSVGEPTLLDDRFFLGFPYLELDIEQYSFMFPNTKLPRKGSCREIAGMEIVEKGE